MGSLLMGGLKIPPQRKIFISYHHGLDREYYEEFSRFFCDSYEAIEDRSVERKIGSDNAEYVIRRIREDYITGTSCTIVLCGAQTFGRRFVDWEIKASLDKEHGLIGIVLPTNVVQNGRYIVPDRLLDNINTGYAVWLEWNQLNGGPQFLTSIIEEANAKQKSLIDNTRQLRKRSV